MRPLSLNILLCAAALFNAPIYAATKVPLDQLPDPFALVERAIALVHSAIPEPSIYSIVTHEAQNPDERCSLLGWKIRLAQNAIHSGANFTFSQRHDGRDCVTAYHATIEQSPGHVFVGIGPLPSQLPSFSTLKGRVHELFPDHSFLVENIAIHGRIIGPHAPPVYAAFSGDVCNQKARIVVDLESTEILRQLSQIPTCS